MGFQNQDSVPSAAGRRGFGGGNGYLHVEIKERRIQQKREWRGATKKEGKVQEASVAISRGHQRGRRDFNATDVHSKHLFKQRKGEASTVGRWECALLTAGAGVSRKLGTKTSR